MLEMLVFLILVALVASIGLVNFGGSGRLASAKHLARSTSAVIHQARNEAISKGRVIPLSVDFQKNNLTTFKSEPALNFGNSIKIKVRTATDLVSEGTAKILMNPDGSSTGGGIEITDGRGRTETVQINWLTGIPKILLEDSQ